MTTQVWDAKGTDVAGCKKSLLYKKISELQYLQRMTPLPARDSSPLQCGHLPASVRWRASFE